MSGDVGRLPVDVGLLTVDIGWPTVYVGVQLMRRNQPFERDQPLIMGVWLLMWRKWLFIWWNRQLMSGKTNSWYGETKIWCWGIDCRYGGLTYNRGVNERKFSWLERVRAKNFRAMFEPSHFRAEIFRAVFEPSHFRAENFRAVFEPSHCRAAKFFEHARAMLEQSRVFCKFD